MFDLSLRILSVSYDEPLLRTRRMMLEAQGYEVTSCACLEEALKGCKEKTFDLLILGHSIPTIDKHRLIGTFRRYSPAIIISLIRHSGDDFVAGADYHFQTDPEPLLKLIAEIVKESGGHTILDHTSEKIDLPDRPDWLTLSAFAQVCAFRSPFQCQ